MRERRLKLVIAFDTTTQAMAMEKMCREEKLSGRLIPLPGAVSAGCGLSWCTDITNRAETEEKMAQHKIGYEGIYEVLV